MAALRVMGILAGCVLVALGIAYCFTYEPAPRVAIRWREGLSADRRQVLERRFLLVNPAADRDRLEYDLLDTSRANIQALVVEPDVADTDRVSREGFTVPLDVPYGTRWMWVAHRTPVLRIPGVILSTVAFCTAILIAAVALELRGSIRRRARRVERGAHLIDG
jgi:hypothetical protein